MNHWGRYFVDEVPFLQVRKIGLNNLPEDSLSRTQWSRHWNPNGRPTAVKHTWGSSLQGQAGLSPGKERDLSLIRGQSNDKK